ncbi:Nucleoside 2-deoxyribosyltransferase [Oceanobacillus limi]|uniref:Nucleoside 2-deoxyribosyltransferase n=1 Tax=Oceanobacillus limi TaxID=930131 RepID=A0A1I0CX24_9BACI|nr:nucleoside 2-deoxyribosyltransferase [Oceanobacillus limi]SET24306.1 Nucleoside 2-deoxyribosyltransferase [Oceanobacillus limi]
MKFYIASGFENKDLVQYVRDELKKEGHLHTYDWTQNVRATTEDKLGAIGELEKQAVADCDFLVLLLPGGRGTHTELGMALAYGKPVFLYSPDTIDLTTATTFYYVEGVKHFIGSIDQFLNELKVLI